MNKLSEKRRLVLTILVSVVLTGGLVALIMKDRSAIEEIETETRTYEQRILVADREISKMKEREDAVLVFRAVEQEELAILPTKQKITSFHRNLSTFLASADLKFQDLPDSEAKESSLAPGIFVTRTELACRGTAAALLKFANMMENDPRLIAVKGLDIQAGQRNWDDESEPVLHDLGIVLETYYYSPPSVGDREHITAQEARLEEPAIAEAIESFEPERPDTYVLRPSAARRDVFIDPRIRRIAPDPEAEQARYNSEQAIVIEVEQLVDDLKEKSEIEAALLVDGDLFKRDRVAAQIEKDLNELRARLGQVEQMKLVTIEDLGVRIKNASAAAADLASRRPPRDVTVTRAIAEKMAEDVRRSFEAGQYGTVVDETTAWHSYLAGKTVEPDARRFCDVIDGYQERAHVLAEFSALSIHYAGGIVSPDPSKSVALINNRSYHIGDVIDATEGVKVIEIARSYVGIAYKGEEIRVDRNRSTGNIKAQGRSKAPRKGREAPR